MSQSPAPSSSPPVVAALVALTTVGVGWPSLFYPFGRDQGNYAYAARVLLDGGAPYLDVFLFKPPMTAVVHAVATAVFGATQYGIRVLDLGWTALSAVLLASVVARLGGGPVGGAVAGATIPLLVYPLRYWDLAQSDGWMGWCLVAAAWLAVRGVDQVRRSPWPWLASGACVGLAVGFKYTAVGFAVPLAALVLALSWPDRRRAAAAIGWGALGATAIIAVLTAWILLSGAGPAFVDSQLDLVPKYVTNTGGDRGFAAVARFASTLAWSPYLHPTGWAAALGLAAAVVGLVAGPPRLRALVGFGLLWLAFASASTISQGKFFMYHFAPLFAPTALLVGIAGALAARGVARLPVIGRAGWVAPVALGALWVTAAALGPIRERQQALWPVLTGAQSLDHYWHHYAWYVRRNYSAGDVVDLARWLRDETEPTDRVFHWGYEPSVNYLADRRTGSRFLYNYPFRVEWSNPAYKTELLGALAADPPELFVVGSRDATRAVTRNRYDSLALLKRWPELDAFVGQTYRLVGMVGRYRIYERRDRPARAEIRAAPRPLPAPGADAADDDG